MTCKPLRELGGVNVYIGEPRTGKTWLALHDLDELRAATGRGAIVIDSTGASNFAELPHTPSAAHTIATAWHGGLAYYTPRDQDDFDAIVSAELATRHGVALFVDEVSYWRVGKTTQFDKLTRTWRHHVPGIFVTTQRLNGDITETLLACAPRVRLFRMKVPVDYHRKIRWLGIEPDQLATLPDRTFQTHQL